MLGSGVNDCVDGSDEAGKSQAGAIAGAVVGSLFFVVAATLVAWWSCRNCLCCSVCGKGAETAAAKENTDPAHMPIENQAYEFTDPAAEPAADSGVINVVGSWDDEFTASAAAPAAATTAAEPAAAAPAWWMRPGFAGGSGGGDGGGGGSGGEGGERGGAAAGAGAAS